MRPSVPPPRTVLLLLLLLLSTVGCATGGASSHSGGEGAAGDARLHVRNTHWGDLTIYLDREGSLFRLGVVPGNQGRTLRVPGSYMAGNRWARLVAVTTGRVEHASSQVFGLAPGDHGTWEIALMGRVSPVSFGEAPEGG